MYVNTNELIVANSILSMIPEPQRRRICEAATLQDIPRGTVLFEANIPLCSVYFFEDGVTALTVPLREGIAVEASSVGKEGMAGLPLFLNCESSAFRAVQDVPGHAYRLAKNVFIAELDRGPDLRLMLGRYTQATLNAAGQRAACNTRHSIDQRLVRWILTTDDQVGNQPFRTSHALIAEMLGVRRASVSVAAGLLQDAGYIAYRRTRIEVVNRLGLEALACECYDRIRNEYLRTTISAS
jgi:CRP-like cAMP-binding protein